MGHQMARKKNTAFTGHDLYKKYFELYQFLATFNVTVYGPVGDWDAVWGRHSPFTVTPEQHRVIRQQADAMLAMSPFPKQAIIDIVHRRFEPASQVRPWFEKVLKLLKQRVEIEHPG